MSDKIDLSARIAALTRMAQSANQAAELLQPGTVTQPQRGDAEPYLFQYANGANLLMTPRAGYGLMSFQQLRALAATSKEVRLNIELIKRTMRGLEWQIRPRSASRVDGYAPDISATMRLFERPDGSQTFDGWLSSLLEDLLVMDAVTLYPEMDADGCCTGVSIVDGSTIVPLLDARGRTPAAPAPAYIQVINGIPASWYTAERMIYAPLNSRTNTPYGQSPIEWAVLAINTALRHDLARLGAFTDGNIPGVMVQIDMEKSTPEQIQVFQQYFDALVSGDINRASKILFLPSMGGQSIFQPSAPDVDKIEADRWLMQVVSWAFGNNPAEFGLVASSGLGGAGYVAGMENAQYRTMTGNISGYLKSLFDMILSRYMHRPDLEFVWTGLEPVEDEQKRASINAAYISAGVYPAAYVQDMLGVPEKYRSALVTPPPPAVPEPYTLTRAWRYDLHQWRKAAIALAKNQKPEPPDPRTIPAHVRADIESKLAGCKNDHDAAQVFDTLLALDDDALRKRFSLLPLDPMEQIKTIAETEMGAALEEYLRGLKARVIDYVSKHPVA